MMVSSVAQMCIPMSRSKYKGGLNCCRYAFPYEMCC